ncbi:TPA: hypothetical protein HA351_16180 [Methanosarcinaceae archaeon]|nr:hypothetical protein [Methanosarcinaceae archaeon]
MYVLICISVLLFASGCAEDEGDEGIEPVPEDIPLPEEIPAPGVEDAEEAVEDAEGAEGVEGVEGAEGVEGVEGAEGVEGGEVSVEVLQAPESVETGQSFLVRWQVNSPVETEISHTAVHYGPEPVSGELTLESYPFLTVPKNGSIPAEFEDSLVLEEAGTVYFRAHAIVDETSYWSDEQSIEVLEPGLVPGLEPGLEPEIEPETEIEPEIENESEGVSGGSQGIEVLDYPTSIEGGEYFTVRWEVTGGTPGEISETVLISGSESGNESLADYPTKSSPQGGTTPKEFEFRLRAPISGDIYFRAYAVVDDAEIFSPEYEISVSEASGSSGY